MKTIGRIEYEFKKYQREKTRTSVENVSLEGKPLIPTSSMTRVDEIEHKYYKMEILNLYEQLMWMKNFQETAYTGMSNCRFIRLIYHRF